MSESGTGKSLPKAAASVLELDSHARKSSTKHATRPYPPPLAAMPEVAAVAVALALLLLLPSPPAGTPPMMATAPTSASCRTHGCARS